MGHNRFFSSITFEPHQEVVLEGDEFLHLSRVMRLAKGDSCRLVNGNGAEAEACIKKIEKERAFLEIISVYEEKRESLLTLVIPILAPTKLHLIVEKTTELGVDHILFYPADLSEKEEIRQNGFSRLERLAISALKQSNRLFLPSLHITPSLFSWKEKLDPSFLEGALFYGDPDGHNDGDNKEPFMTAGLSKRISFASGPERGFSEKEVVALQSMGFSPLLLNRSVLRSETAPIAFAAIYNFFNAKMQSS